MGKVFVVVGKVLNITKNVLFGLCKVSWTFNKDIDNVHRSQCKLVGLYSNTDCWKLILQLEFTPLTLF